MNGLADILVKLPIGEVDDWENYFWYAIGASPSNLPVFKNVPEAGTWVEKEDSLYSIPSQNVHVRSPISGIVRGLKIEPVTQSRSSEKCLYIQPVKGFILPEKSGEIMFNEIIKFGHKIEYSIIEYERKSFLQKLFAGGEPYGNVKSRRDDPKKLLDLLDKLVDVRCDLVSIGTI